MMKGSSEYVVMEGGEATFEALRDVVRERGLSVLEDDPQHLRLAFRLDQSQEGEQMKALCAILDFGHGPSKIVVVCVDEADGSVVSPDASLDGLFIHIEHKLHTTRGTQKSSLFHHSRSVEMKEARMMASKVVAS
jgi:hypothetical protein